MVQVAETRSPRQVVFVGLEPSARMAKIAGALRARGWETILINLSQPPLDASESFSATYPCTSPAHALWMATKFKPVVYHIFDSWTMSLAKQFLSHRPGKIVLDLYDVMNGAIREGSWSKRDVYFERRCLEGFDGICARSLTLQIPKNIGCRLPEKVLFFPEYCIDHAAHLPKRTDGLHIVFVGTVPFQYIYDRHGCGPCDMDFIRAITARRIHYHLYPASGLDYEERFKPYLEHAEINPYFHFHRPLGHREMLKEISQYHLGILSVSEDTLLRGDWTFNPLTLKYFIPNKVFDYLDANLGVVLYGGKTVNWLMERTGTTLIRSRDQIMTDPACVFEDFARQEGLLEKIEATRKKFAIQPQAERLEKFYDSMSGGKARWPILRNKTGKRATTIETF